MNEDDIQKAIDEKYPPEEHNPQKRITIIVPVGYGEMARRQWPETPVFENPALKEITDG